MMSKKVISLKNIKRLALSNSANSLEQCMNSQLTSGGNVCITGLDTEGIISSLAKAAFVRATIEKDGITVNEAIRVLGARMRRFAGYSGSEIQ